MNITVTEPDTAANSFTGTGAVPIPQPINLAASGAANLDGGGVFNDLAPGATMQFSATYTITQADIDAGGVSNSALARATDPFGSEITDSSDDNSAGNGANGIGNDDPTQTVFDIRSALVLNKEIVESKILFPTVYEITYEISARNSGNITQTDISLIDDLANSAAPAVIRSATITSISGFEDAQANPDYTGTGINGLLSPSAAGTPTLEPMQTGVVNLVVVYETAQAELTYIANTVSGSSALIADLRQVSTAYNTIYDDDGDGSDDSFESTVDDRDGDGIVNAEDYDPTGYFYCEENGAILTGGQITVSGNGVSQTGVGTNGNIIIQKDGYDGYYQWFVTAAGTYTMSYTNPEFGRPSTNRLAITAPTRVDDLVDVIANSTSTNPRILGASVDGPGESARILSDFSLDANPRYYTTFVIEAGDANVFLNNLPFEACSTPGNLSASKIVSGDKNVTVGDIVSYQIEYTLDNTGGVLSDGTFIDLLPVGMIYVPNSAQIDGQAVEPAINGQRLSWGARSMRANSSTVLTLQARVASNARLGELVNQTYVEDSAGQRLSNIAQATVVNLSDPVFDCSDVIGKVFEDRNHNGYQDEGELGIPDVRIFTVQGARIKTDEYGRFHVPCAINADKIGSNLILKLDPRSLPKGYRLTTENPRVLRLSAGKLGKINFGVAPQQQ